MKYLQACSALLSIGSCHAFSSARGGPFQHISKLTLQISPKIQTTTCKNRKKSCLQNRASNIPANEIDNNDKPQAKPQDSTDLDLTVPSVQRIIKFAIPAIGIYLCSPLLSTIDTSSVGLLCGTLQQAALNPAVTIIDYSARTMSFLYTGTTNIIASSKQKTNSDEIKDTFLGSLRLAFLVGVGLATILLLTSQKLLVPLIGNASIDVELLSAAWQYFAIRSLGMPAAAMIGTSQAACLGLEDNKTPFKIIVIAALLNLVLDIALVGRKVPWLGGTAGAAWATTISQYFALWLFLRQFSRTTGGANDEGLLSTRGLLSGRLNLKTFLRWPCKKTMESFRQYVIPVTTTQIGRCSTYIAMGHTVSSTLDTVSMAAQQIITSLFYTLIPVGDSCSLTAQSFLPPIVMQDASEERTKSVTKTVKNIYKVAGGLGIILSIIAASIPLACPLLTTDPAVIASVKSVVPIMLAILSTHGIFCASEGILLGFKDLKFLGRIYAVFFAVVPMLMLRLKYAARAGRHITLLSVWNVFLGYQTFRISAFVSRVLMLRHRHAKEDICKAK
jgi:putative MATE family efflux protein